MKNGAGRANAVAQAPPRSIVDRHVRAQQASGRPPWLRLQQQLARGQLIDLRRERARDNKVCCALALCAGHPRRGGQIEINGRPVLSLQFWKRDANAPEAAVCGQSESGRPGPVQLKLSLPV